MAYCIATLLILYILIILLLVFGFYRLKYNKYKEFQPEITFSICIAFRNEAENLSRLLTSLAALNYPENLFEIILVDDHSADNSVKIITEFCQKNTVFSAKTTILSQKSTSEGGKKAALALAVQHAKKPFIVTTDADCAVPATWLSAFNTFILQEEKTFVAGPVALFGISNSFLNAFQQLDFLSLQGATMGAFGIRKPFLCNGANLAFAKTEFFRLSGYEGNTEIASGDDLFLMQKFIKDNPENVGYLKSQNSIVCTQPQQCWNQLINQRKRWAAKASNYQRFMASLTGWAVFLGNFASILAVFYLKNSVLMVVLFGFKILMDFLLIAQSARFFDKKVQLSGYLWSFLFYPFFTIYIAISSQLQPFEWKGRCLRK